MLFSSQWFQSLTRNEKIEVHSRVVFGLDDIIRLPHHVNSTDVIVLPLLPLFSLSNLFQERHYMNKVSKVC